MAPRGAAGTSCGRVERRERGFASIEIDHASRSQRHIAVVAFKQQKTQRRLKLLDRPTERWLRQMQPGRGTAEMQFLADYKKITQLLDVHDA